MLKRDDVADESHVDAQSPAHLDRELNELSLPDLQSELKCTLEGMTQEDAGRRSIEFGFNEIPEKGQRPLLKFLSYFWGPIPWMIEVAALLSALVQHWEDFAIILVLLVGNAVVGFWEEFQAGNAIAALKSRLALNARVRRDGKWTSIPARELVPGDVVRMRLGDIVPADAKLLDSAKRRGRGNESQAEGLVTSSATKADDVQSETGDSVEVDQSALTGESLPVTRKAGETVFSGSIIKQGEIDALIFGTGGNTYFGKTAKLVETAQTTSHFQKAVLKIGDFLIVVAVALVSLILLVALFRGDPITETLQFALVLTVAAIPVAMPTVLSVTMAVGARVLARGQAIVSRLASIEELAGMDVLCSDKTGTLTQNKLALGEPFIMNGITKDELLLAAALASRAENKDPIDEAVLAGCDGVRTSDYEVVHFQPFDPVHKRTEATVHDSRGGEFKTSKGAPQVIMDLVDSTQNVADEETSSASKDSLPHPLHDRVQTAIDDFAKRGFRSLGVAQWDAHNGWRFLGVLPLSDPPREDSASTIATAHQMGCAVKMVTGDQLAIAREVATQLDMGFNLVDAQAFQDTSYQDASQVDALIERADGFAQVYPEHKFHIVDVLQKHGHIVGMTGDGVNDAPALKKADCGIAVSGATDAARAAADIVLLSPGLSVVIDAIKESRKIFQRMTSYAIYRIAETIRVLLFMTLSILVFNFYPVTAVMIVLLALLNDGAILSIAYDRVQYANMPERWDMRLVLGVASVLGLAGVAASFGLFYLAEQVYQLDRDTIQSLMYLKLSVAGHLTIFATRTRGPFWSIRPARILFLAVLGTQVIATLLAVYGILMAPIGWKLAGLIWCYALAWFLVNDRLKVIAYRIFDPSNDVLTQQKKEDSDE
ncbi:Calcium-transporting ATPase 1 [Novipirellula aureliae]|uniref:Calcium-transporting ATPase 1 n=1 Tax=Novipirellula aureliae TaxID=2527966 RepID=A0A5C6E6F5_9BACT|nr:plasma-membrane proton-efflux P-type ATPase [Novipirellula aureliae]TWU44418.1 Calcium-transporting ATPase 1 [Novipirellula aureliae]